MYGVIWRFLGPLILMPLALGMGSMLTAEGMRMAFPASWVTSSSEAFWVFSTLFLPKGS